MQLVHKNRNENGGESKYQREFKILKSMGFDFSRNEFFIHVPTFN